MASDKKAKRRKKRLVCNKKKRKGASDDGTMDFRGSEDEVHPMKTTKRKKIHFVSPEIRSTRSEKKVRSKHKGKRCSNKNRKKSTAVQSIQDEARDLQEYTNQISRKYKIKRRHDEDSDNSFIANDDSDELSDDGSGSHFSVYSDSDGNSTDSAFSAKACPKPKVKRALFRNKVETLTSLTDGDGLDDGIVLPAQPRKKARSKQKGKRWNKEQSLQDEARDLQEYTNQISRKYKTEEASMDSSRGDSFEESDSSSDDDSESSLSNSNEEARKGKRPLDSKKGGRTTETVGKHDRVDSESEDEVDPSKFKKKFRLKRKGNRPLSRNKKQKAVDGLIDSTASEDSDDDQPELSIQDEVKDLQEYNDLISRKPKAKKVHEESDAPARDSVNHHEELPPINPVCKKCIQYTEMDLRFSQKRNKHYFKCWRPRCPEFFWSDSPEVMSQLPSGPPCHCGRPSAAIRDDERRALWVCANTNVHDQNHCDFECVVGEEPDNATAIDGNRAVPSQKKANRDNQFIVGGESLRRLQELFEVSVDESPNIYGGIDFRQGEPRGYYDNFDVVKAWKISAPLSAVESFNKFRQQVEDVQDTIEVRPEYAKACHEFIEGETHLDPLDPAINEKLLLHGTNPRVVASILEKSLDPGMASEGLFGAGTYFAEHPIKINQYVVEDEEWKGGARERRHGPICGLHNKLYPRPDMHPGNVFYALVCRVVMGNPDRTINLKRKPAAGHHSILAELGGAIKRFREFVVFDKRAINIEYLVAYQRVRKYCYCNPPIEVGKRTIEKQDDRPCITCANSWYNHQQKRWEGGCGLFAALPRCYCPNRRRNDFWAADKDVKNNKYCCRVGKCKFHRWIKQGVDLREAEDAFDDDGDDEYDTNDGFVVPDDEPLV